jgi:hypothetical protein
MDEKLFSKRNNRGNMEQVEPDGWCNPAFQKFLKAEIIGVRP